MYEQSFGSITDAGAMRFGINQNRERFINIGEFIDTQVKHYSSGMYMRLAFSVAAHLESEILLVDEVLAVGDATFQAKCIRKMEGVAQSGRTVVFVSHAHDTVARLCTRVVLVEDGRAVGVRLRGRTGGRVEAAQQQEQPLLVGRAHERTGRMGARGRR